MWWFWRSGQKCLPRLDFSVVYDLNKNDNFGEVKGVCRAVYEGFTLVL